MSEVFFFRLWSTIVEEWTRAAGHRLKGTEVDSQHDNIEADLSMGNFRNPLES